MGFFTRTAMDALMKTSHPEINRRQCWNLHPHRKPCTECKDICPYGEEIFTRPNLVKDWDPCTDCGLCVSACRSGCIAPSPEQVQRDTAAADTDNDTIWIGCEKSSRKNTVVRSCICALSWEALAYLALNKKIVLDLTPCGQCENDLCAEQLRKELTRLVDFFGQPMFEARFSLAYEEKEYPYHVQELTRREMLEQVSHGSKSGTKKLLPLLKGCDTAVLPGLSSLSYLCARLKTSYEDVRVVSLHGRQCNILPEVRANGRLFTLVGGERGINDLCRTLTAGGLGGVAVSVGQRLGYPDERIVRGTAAELAEGDYASLSVALIENPRPDAVVTPGLPDDAFLRSAEGMPVVPMTKSEVRAVCLSKLRLTERSVCWDIGAGTGSVSVEMALQAKQGLVCAVERREDAAALLEQNRERFALENLRVVCGSAPEACAGLPAPTHAFIGGSAGNMREIVALLLARNPRVRIVATTVSLESIAELTDCLTAFPFAETEVVSLQVARDRRAGGYHLMSGQNPIYIFTMQGGGEQT